MSCPKCGNNQWKLASLVHQEGLTHVDTKSKSLGVGVGGGHLGIGYARGKQTGVHQTELSKMAAPPKTSEWTVAMFAGAVMTGIFGIFASFWFVFTALFVIGMFVVMGSEAKSDEARMQDWREQRICMSCGHFYKP